MSVGAAEGRMARAKGRPKKPGGAGSQVRIETDIASMARYVCAQTGTPLIDYLSKILRPAVERDFRKAGKQLMEGGGEGPET
jgi:hypothetical protein